MEPIALARAYALETFPGAEAAFLAGSVATGRTTATSDLDIVVVQGEVAAETYRETLRHRGRLIELFVHTPATVEQIFDADIASRRGSSLSMYAGGIVLLSRGGRAEQLQARAQRLLNAGPPPVDASTLESWRYELTSSLDDLADLTDRAEYAVCASDVLERAGDLICARVGWWIGRGKWLPRRLLEADPGQGGRLLKGYSAATSPAGEPGSLIDAALDVLAACGGPVREGYRRTWPGSATARR